MPRKARTSPAEGFVNLIARLPWWLCLLLAVISHWVLRHFAVLPTTGAATPAKVPDLILPAVLSGLAMAGQYILPLLFTVAALLSGLHAYQQRTRSTERGGSESSESPSQSPECPVCGAHMVTRHARRGANAGQRFWGCSQYPACKGTRPLP